jgi:hypothetical protein
MPVVEHVLLRFELDPGECESDSPSLADPAIRGYRTTPPENSGALPGQSAPNNRRPARGRRTGVVSSRPTAVFHRVVHALRAAGDLVECTSGFRLDAAVLVFYGREHGQAGTAALKNPRSVSAISARTCSPESTTPIMVSDVWVCPRAVISWTGTPSASIALA